MAKRATPADSPTPLTIPFTVLVDPATDKFTIDLKTKSARIQGGQPIAWEITNTVPKTIKVSVVGLDSAMEKGFKSTVAIQGGEIKRIEGTVKDPGLFSETRRYALWLSVNGRQIAVDPDLEIERPPDGGVVIKNATGNVDVDVTLSENFTISNDPALLQATVGQDVTWTITNQSPDQIAFDIAFPGAVVSFKDGKHTVTIPASNGQGKDGTGTLIARVLKPGRTIYGERAKVEGETGYRSSTPDFWFT